MRKVFGLVAVAILFAALLPGSAFASENIIKFFERHNETFITQGEWAVVLVRALGEEADMPSNSTQHDYIAMLEKNRIQPMDGWNDGEFLSYGAKAVTMVQALGIEEQLPPDAEEMDYVWLLGDYGFHEGHPVELVRRRDAVQRNVNDPIYQELAGNEFNISLSKFAPRIEAFE